MKIGDKVVCVDDSPCVKHGINLGITKNRYALNGESTALNDLFIDIQSKEPEILQSINISDFVNGQIF